MVQFRQFRKPKIGVELPLLMLPYYRARIRMVQRRESFYFETRRQGIPAAEFRVNWQVGQPLRDPDQDSLAFFLIERYYAFSVEHGSVYHIRIYHHPWILEEATVRVEFSSMFSALGLSELDTPPLVHFSRSQDVELWPPVPADGRSSAGENKAEENLFRWQNV